MERLFLHPEREFSLTELAREAGVAKPHASRIINDLLQDDLIVITKLSKIWRIKSKQSSFSFTKNKIIYNLNFIYQSGIVEFLNEYFNNPKCIVLFGSFRRGEDLSSSDIDIAIETGKNYEILKLKNLNEFEKLINRSIQIHLFNRESTDINVFNSIANGIVLEGFLEVKP